MHTGVRAVTRRRREFEKVPIDVIAPPAHWETRGTPHRLRYGESDFPFWKLTFAIATAIIFAAAVIWTVMEMRARYELEALTRQLEVETRRMEADARKQEAALKMQFAQQAHTRRGDALSRASLSTQRPNTAASSIPFMNQGSSAMPTGAVACMFGYQSQRQSSGGWQQLLIQGKAQPCRTP